MFKPTYSLICRFSYSLLLNLEQRRKCISCGELKSKEKLIKITKEHESGNIIVQPNSKTFGRSAYLCYNESCINQAFKKNRLNKVLKTNKNIDKESLLSCTQPTNK